MQTVNSHRDWDRDDSLRLAPPDAPAGAAGLLASAGPGESSRDERRLRLLAIVGGVGEALL